MKRVILLVVSLVAAGVGANLACAGVGGLDGIGGIFLRVFAGYVSLICLTHCIFLFLPKIGLGSDIRQQ